MRFVKIEKTVKNVKYYDCLDTFVFLIFHLRSLDLQGIFNFFLVLYWIDTQLVVA